MAKRSRLGPLVVVGFIAAGLLGWGATTNFRGSAASVATVDDLPVDVNRYASLLRRQADDLAAQTGERLDAATLQQIGLDREVLNGLIAERVLDAEAARLGLSAGDERVAAAIAEMPAFQGPDGQVNRDIYRDALARNGFDPRTFEAAIRDEQARRILFSAITAGASVDPGYATAQAQRLTEARTLSWAPYPVARVAPATPTDDDLSALIAAEPERFSTPETRTISYVWVTPEMIQDTVTVDDASVRDLYDQRIDEFVQAERRLVERLLFDTEAEAADARDRLDQGNATFESLAEERGLRLSDTDLGDVAAGDLDDAGDAVFAAATGEVVGPIMTDLGLALFRVNAVLAADETPFAEVEPQLRAELANQRARRVIDERRADLADLLAGGATFDDIATRTELERGSIDWQAGLSDGPAAYAEVREAFATLVQGAPPVEIDLADGGLMLASLDAVTPAELRPLDEVRADAEALWTERAQAGAALDAASAAAERLSDGADFADEGLAAVTEAPVTLPALGSLVPPDVAAAVFALPVGGATVVMGDRGPSIVRVDAASGPSVMDPEFQEVAAGLSGQIGPSFAADVADAFVSALRDRAEIQVDDRAMAAALQAVQ